MSLRNIFVYGTLKRGFPNYNEQHLKRFYVGVCKTVAPYSLVIADQYYVPVLLQDCKELIEEQVTGELYQVDKETLAWLDRLEGVGRKKGYRRFTIEVLMSSNDIKTADVYMKTRKDIETIHNELSSIYEKDSRYIPPKHR